MTSDNSHEIALFRLIIERLVETSRLQMTDQDDGNDDDDDRDQSRKRRKRNRLGVGCQSSLSRMTMINLRMELSGIHQGKLSIGQVENALNKFESRVNLKTKCILLESSSLRTTYRVIIPEKVNQFDSALETCFSWNIFTKRFIFW